MTNQLTKEDRGKLAIWMGFELDDEYDEWIKSPPEMGGLSECFYRDEWRPDEDDAQWAMVLDAARENGYLTQIIDGANEACEVFMWHGKANRHACKIASNRRLATCRAVLAMLAEAKESENGVR